MMAFGMSPEDRAEYEAEQAKQRETFIRLRMATQEALKDMFNNMSVEDLVTFRKLMHAVAHAPEGEALAMFFEGRAHSLLVHVHDVCPRCGVNHTDQAIEEILELDCSDETPHDPDVGMDNA